MDINNITASTRMYNQQVQLSQTNIEQQRLRQDIIKTTAPEGATVVKPQSQSAQNASIIKSRYLFAVGNDGRRVLRLQIDLSPSNVNVLA